jgi:hypothetical protein
MIIGIRILSFSLPSTLLCLYCFQCVLTSFFHLDNALKTKETLNKVLIDNTQYVDTHSQVYSSDRRV